jgi:hypothetical protein
MCSIRSNAGSMTSTARMGGEQRTRKVGPSRTHTARSRSARNSGVPTGTLPITFSPVLPSPESPVDRLCPDTAMTPIAALVQELSTSNRAPGVQIHAVRSIIQTFV